MAAAIGAALVFVVRAGSGPPPSSALIVEAGELLLSLPDGGRIGGERLLKAVIEFGDGRSFRIEAIEHRLTPGGELPLYDVRARQPNAPADEWQPICQPDAQGGRWALALGDSDGKPQLTCSAGATGKCLLFGYLPWRDAEPYHAACLRMLRADYCGDGVGHTRDGVPIDFYDRAARHLPSGDVPVERFEAGWTSAGAVCVRRMRLTDGPDLGALAQACPRLAGRLGEVCDEPTAASLGALLFNRRPDREAPPRLPPLLD